MQHKWEMFASTSEIPLFLSSPHSTRLKGERIKRPDNVWGHIRAGASGVRMRLCALSGVCLCGRSFAKLWSRSLPQPTEDTFRWGV